MNRRRQRWALGAILSIGLALIALSTVVESPVTDAAPELFAGVVVLAVAAAILRVAGSHTRLLAISGGALAVGGVGACYTGLATLLLVPTVAVVETVGDLSLLVGLVLFVYDRRLWEHWPTIR